MTSLMQFHGETDRHKGVNLIFERPWEKLQPGGYRPSERFFCKKCQKEHGVLYTAWRKPAGMFGCWVVFRYNGTEHVPDLSVPIDVEDLPRGAIRMSDENACTYWTN